MARRRKYATTPPPEVPARFELPIEEPKELDIQEVIVDKVNLHFNQPVEIYINGTPYIGADIEAPNYSVAAEIVRNAKTAYGNEVI